jgi:ATP-binding cassette, sub-family E, member 1
VATVLHDAVKKYGGSLIEPLQIMPLMMSKLSELSGGELQRVAVCLCLAQEADLFLLDEPSAYLDVEQRLLISKLLKEQMEARGKTALVVDHDLLFIDYISDELMVFDGVPSESGKTNGPFDMVEGMNLFLRDLGMTFRRDPESQRPRANKPGSVKDREQIAENKLYYV